MTETRKKQWGLLLLAAAAVVALVVLAAGLRDLEFSPGQFLPRHKDARDVSYSESAPPPLPFEGELFSGLLVLMGLIVPLSLIYLVVSPSARKYVLRGLGLLMWLLALVVLMRAQPLLFEQTEQQAPKMPPIFDPKLRDVDFAANPPPWLTWLFTIAVALLLAWGIVALVLYLWRRAHSPESALDQLAQEAQQALDALQAGADLQDTVLRCYFEMNQLAREKKDLVREETVTTREFETYLAQVGLPEQHVRQLTRLFEEVRYGARSPAGQDEQRAIDCLAAIIESCQGAA